MSSVIQGYCDTKKMDFDEEDDFFTMENLCILKEEESKILEAENLKSQNTVPLSPLNSPLNTQTVVPMPQVVAMERSAFIFQGENNETRFPSRYSDSFCCLR